MGAEFCGPIDLAQFDRTPTLSDAERAALAAYPAVQRGGIFPRSGEARQIDRALTRLTAPLTAIWRLRPADQRQRCGARRVLYQEMLRRDRAFWAWSPDEWLETLRESPRAFTLAYGECGGRGRFITLACAYLFGEVTDIRPTEPSQAVQPLARLVFGASRVDAAIDTLVRAVFGPTGLGYITSAHNAWAFRSAVCLALLLNRSPQPEALSADLLAMLVTGAKGHRRNALRALRVGLQHLGVLAAPSTAPSTRPGVFQDEAVDPVWAAWCWAWSQRAVGLSPTTRLGTRSTAFAVGRWLQRYHPAVTTPEQWDEDLALQYVEYLCTTARIGDDLGPYARTRMARRGHLGRPFSPRGIAQRLNGLRRLFTDWQDRPHAVLGGPARRIPVRFKPTQAFATPRRISQLQQPDPRDIDLAVWYKLAYAAATLDAAELSRQRLHHYPITLYRAVALLWVTAARRPDELRRLRVGCVRREWLPTMCDEHGHLLPQAEGELCYLQVPPNKTTGMFWIWIPTYTADAIVAWERDRPVQQPARLDAKDNAVVDYLFLMRDRRLGDGFLNDSLIPLLCRAAGVPERDARGAFTAHRGRSTRATLLRRLGVSLEDIAAYLGHANPDTVRHYARTDDTQLALTIKRADARSRLVEGLIDIPAAQAGQPNVFFFLGRGPDGQPRYCGNPAWASCPHRLACLKCQMYVGGTVAEVLEAREGVLRFQTQVPMTPEEQAATEGDLARLDERLAELRGLPTPAPPHAGFVFNPAPPPVATTTPATLTVAERRAVQAARLAVAQQELATAEATGQRSILVRALRNEIATLEQALSMGTRAAAHGRGRPSATDSATRDGPPARAM